MKYLLILFLATYIGYGQQVDTNEISIVKKIDGLNANQIFSRLNFIIDNIFKSPDDIIQFNDPKLNKIIIKANTEIPVPNQNKIMYPNAIIEYPDEIMYLHRYTFNVSCRDGRYKMTINFNRGEFPGKTKSNPQSPYLAIMRPTSGFIAEQVYFWKNEVKTKDWILISKKKKQLLIESIPSHIKDYSKNLENYGKYIFNLIHENMLESKYEDDW